MGFHPAVFLLLCDRIKRVEIALARKEVVERAAFAHAAVLQNKNFVVLPQEAAIECMCHYDPRHVTQLDSVAERGRFPAVGKIIAKAPKKLTAMTIMLIRLTR